MDETERVEALLRGFRPLPPPPAVEAAVVETARVRRSAPPSNYRRMIAMAASLMCVAAVFWAVFSAQPTTVPAGGQDEPTVAELVKRLGSESLEAREAAAAALLKRGEKCRTALEEAAKRADLEIAGRARSVLRKLDLAAFDHHAGKLDGTGVVWADAKAFDLLAEGTDLPEWTKIAVEGDRLTFALVEFKDGRVARSEITNAILRESGSTGPKSGYLHDKVRYSERMGHNHFHTWGSWYGKHVVKHEGSELFGHWPRLRRASLVFVMKQETGGGRDLLKGLQKALSHERADVRAGAAHLLGWFFCSQESIDLAFKALEDGDEGVRAAALSAARTLTGDRDTAPDKLRETWSARQDLERDLQMNNQLRWAEAMWDPRRCSDEP
jgi:hypothetical protein